MAFPYLDYKTMEKFKDEMEKNNVSARARKKDGFFTTYLENKGDLEKLDKINYPNKKHSYLVERNSFLKRTVAQYNKKPTYRRRLAIIAWAYFV
jgi:hypothetical protein